MDIKLKLTQAEKVKIREKKLKEIEQEKLMLYGLPKTNEENEILEKALQELGINNKTDIVCPRCGNGLILLKRGASGELKCLNSKICIKIVYRGI